MFYCLCCVLLHYADLKKMKSLNYSKKIQYYSNDDLMRIIIENNSDYKKKKNSQVKYPDILW